MERLVLARARVAVGKVGAGFDGGIHGVAQYAVVCAFVARRGGGVGAGAATTCCVRSLMVAASDEVLRGVRL